MIVKHATAGAFVFCRFKDGWRLGLIEHPRLGRHMIMGGHVEAFETQAEAAMREVEEESGLRGMRLIDSPTPGLPAGFRHATVAAPWWIAEQDVPADNHLAEAHVHVDHQYVAVVQDPTPVGKAAHRFGWFRADELAVLPLFEDTRLLAAVLFSCLDDVVDGRVDPVTAVRALVGAPASAQRSSRRV
jgi:8-oxo-dGTP pyrophosphatase MutT (NUDIX family)